MTSKSEREFSDLFSEYVAINRLPHPVELEPVPLPPLFPFDKTQRDPFDLDHVRVCRHIANAGYPPARQLYMWRGFPDGNEIIGNYHQHLLICIRCVCMIDDFASPRARGFVRKQATGGKHGRRAVSKKRGASKPLQRKGRDRGA